MNNFEVQQVEDFLTYLNTVKGMSPNTIKGYKSDLNMFFKFLLCNKKVSIDIEQITDNFISNIQLQDLHNFVKYLEVERGNGANARSRKISSLKSFFEYLLKMERIKNNPTINLEMPEIKKENPTYLTLKQCQKLLNAIDGDFKERDYCIITLFLNCGLRISELIKIDLDDIQDDILTVTGKGNKQRSIPLNDMCMNAIKDYLKIRNKNINKIKDVEALFLSKNYTRISTSGVSNTIKKHMKKAKLNPDKYTPHKLRHSAATLMLKHGNVDIRSIQEILGHKSVSTTQIYAHVDDEMLRKATSSNPLNNL
ncbi:tyrosine recombinase XerC (plasmid) [Clostridium tetani]|uniref:tyrosine recombinase XerC n=1 Tax=Clostridium tetani TaxID=1513 RepID=UPI00308C5B89|nr:tyrosine recombinase XerC [Clostridium tetani]